MAFLQWLPVTCNTLPSLYARETEVALLHCKTMHILLVIQSPACSLFMFLAQLCSETVYKEERFD